MGSAPASALISDPGWEPSVSVGLHQAGRQQPASAPGLRPRLREVELGGRVQPPAGGRGEP